MTRLLLHIILNITELSTDDVTISMLIRHTQVDDQTERNVKNSRIRWIVEGGGT